MAQISGTDLLYLHLGENRKVSEFAQYIANLFIVATCHVSKYSQHQWASWVCLKNPSAGFGPEDTSIATLQIQPLLSQVERGEIADSGSNLPKISKARDLDQAFWLVIPHPSHWECQLQLCFTGNVYLYLFNTKSEHCAPAQHQQLHILQSRCESFYEERATVCKNT